ncbi:Protein indeterminate-domain 2 [Vitis vinifera]|uniref:Protein indeterminate-domain 2 n=1 Tax=Vitis vinifera TaxID=29760 RepID=A0A438GS56_VITVI|nr:Protein indeterminate-domain 2 [Vitis vinifera]
MSNLFQGFAQVEQLQSTIIQQSSNRSPNPSENGADGPTPITTALKKKRNLPGNPGNLSLAIYPDAEVVALSPRTLMATNRYICEVCHKGFQRDQNLQLHRRGHNLPWKLKQRSNTEVKKRVKHGEKRWKCDKCSKRYAVQSDWKAHTKICGTREYRCDCGTIFSRKDSFVTHRAFCDASARKIIRQTSKLLPQEECHAPGSIAVLFFDAHFGIELWCKHVDEFIFNPTTSQECFGSGIGSNNSPMGIGSTYTSATALLQKAAEMGAKISDNSIAPVLFRGFTGYSVGSTNSSGSVQETSSVISCSMGPVSATANGLYVGNQETFNKDLDAVDVRPSYAVSHSGLFDSSLFMQMKNQNPADRLEGELFMGDGEKMTVDFLGVEPTTYPSNGKKRSYDGNFMGLEYSNTQQNL